MNYVVGMHNYYETRLDYAEVDFRYTVVPESKLPQGRIPLSFDHAKIMECIQIGYNDTVKAIQEGSEKAGKRIMAHTEELMENWFPSF